MKTVFTKQVPLVSMEAQLELFAFLSQYDRKVEGLEPNVLSTASPIELGAHRVVSLLEAE